jgi:Raf kinase inhibitor-like YbhB/YbcL family protein
MASSLARALGFMLQPIRPGTQALATKRRSLAEVPETIEVTSRAFENGGPIPDRYTGYAEGISPPLAWHYLPDEAISLVLVVEDADAPTLRPLVHAIVTGLAPSLGGLAEGAIPATLTGASPDGWVTGRNAIGRRGWMPIMPPPGHGPHRYAFQIFVLNAEPRFDWPPGREFLLRTIRPHMIARGSLIGIYQRK